jgi:hypothetical protein
LPRDILETYRPKADAIAEYTLDDHPNLLTPSMRPVFESFRRAVLALDPCVSEELRSTGPQTICHRLFGTKTGLCTVFSPEFCGAQQKINDI